MPAIYMDEKTMACLSPAGFTGGDSVYVQLTFNGMDYTPRQENLVFSFYNLVGSFPKSGPADGFDDVIIVRGKGFKPGTHVMCELNKTSIAPVEMNSTHILCPMCLPTKDPKAIGLVKFGVNFDKSYSDFGNFYYYTQIAFTEMQPRYGPNEGKGIIYFQGERFRDDFPGVQIGCKLGDAIGEGVMIDPTTIKCVVPKMNLVDDGFSLPASLALNSHSWVGSSLEGGVRYTPYGIVQMTPNAGPYDGYSDIVVSGKGFTE